MRTIGLIGGMSWESTEAYYRAINLGVKEALGGLHSAQIVMVSVDFEPLEKLQASGDWPAVAAILSQAARQAEAAGAEALLLCTNTMHKVSSQIESAVSIPLLHIADASAVALRRDGLTKVALLGTAFTMEQDFYKGRLADKYGLEVMVPDASDRQLVHRVIYRELCLGQVRPDSRRQFVRIIEHLSEQGAQAVILGCTEIGLLVAQSHTSVALLDTTLVHAQCAVDFLLDRDLGDCQPNRP